MAFAASAVAVFSSICASSMCASQACAHQAFARQAYVHQVFALAHQALALAQRRLRWLDTACTCATPTAPPRQRAGAGSTAPAG